MHNYYFISLSDNDMNQVGLAIIKEMNVDRALFKLHEMEPHTMMLNAHIHQVEYPDFQVDKYYTREEAKKHHESQRPVAMCITKPKRLGRTLGLC